MLDAYDSETGELLAQIHPHTVEECSQPGAVDDAVEYWAPLLEWKAPLESLRRYLSSFGAWDDLETATEETIKQRACWCLCCDLDEEGML